MAIRNSILRRYTDLPALLAILRNREITLLAPSSWDDRNDRHLMDSYKRARKLKTLLALCFSEVSETYHHWKVFSPGSSGVCIEFHRDALLKALPDVGIIHGAMVYKTISQLRSSKPDLAELPFTKRVAFEDEQEYRIIFWSRVQVLETKNISIKLTAIDRIAINPWVPTSLFEAIEETILAIDGCADLKVYHSKLIESPAWKNFADEYI
jgi:hypothetical protein